MIINEKKVSLAEKDVEQWLWENPQSLVVDSAYRVEKWIHRQFAVPSGVIDLIGVTNGKRFIVVEVKNTEIKAEALTQVSRYAFDINNLALWAIEGSGVSDGAVATLIDCLKVVVGRDIDNRTYLEAESMDVHIVTFQVNLSLSVTDTLRWPDNYRQEREYSYSNIANADEQMRAYVNSIAKQEDPSRGQLSPFVLEDHDIIEHIEDLLANGES